MDNYYEKLNLDASSSVSEINKTLSQLESTWKRREINNPEKATAMLALIIEARKVFATDTSRKSYDRELAKSKEKPIEIDPNADRKQQFEKWRADALSYFDNGQYDLAKTAIDRALSYYDASTDNDAFFSLVADVYRMNRSYPTALDYINKAIVINPQYAMHYILKAGIYRDQASSVQGYNNYGEVDRLIQSARESLNQAVNIAHRNNDRTSESAAYGLLSWFYYFVPDRDIDKAEGYAKKSVEMGDALGNGRKVLDIINQVRQQEVKFAEEQRRRREQLAEEQRRRQEQLAKEEQEKKERQAREEQERQRKAKKQRTLGMLYKFCWVGFLAWTVYVIYNLVTLKGYCLYLGFSTGSEFLNIGFLTVIYLVMIALLNLLEKISLAYSALPKVASIFCFGIYAIYVAYTIDSYGYDKDMTLGFVGVNFLILIGVLIIFNAIGKAVRKRMK